MSNIQFSISNVEVNIARIIFTWKLDIDNSTLEIHLFNPNLYSNLSETKPTRILPPATPTSSLGLASVDCCLRFVRLAYATECVG
jgi:hypothetical protein